jgi:hypothetical protein
MVEVWVVLVFFLLGIAGGMLIMAILADRVIRW